MDSVTKDALRRSLQIAQELRDDGKEAEAISVVDKVLDTLDDVVDPIRNPPQP